MSQLSLLPSAPSVLVVAVTGHRADDKRPHRGIGSRSNLGLHRWVKDWLRAQLVELKASSSRLEAVSGMALDVDTWFAELALELEVPLTAAIPFEGQERLWPGLAQAHYRELLSRATRVVNVSGHSESLAIREGRPSTPEEISRMMEGRNRWMVRRCGLLLAVWDTTPGGTGHCVGCARKVERKMRHLNPRDYPGR